MGSAINAFLIWMLGQPAVRAFLEEVFVRLFAELFYRSQNDPAFRTQFTSLSETLQNANSEEEKKNALKQIQALRSASKL